MNVDLNFVCEHQDFRFSVAGLSGSIKPPAFLVVHEQPQFHEQGSGTSR